MNNESFANFKVDWQCSTILVSENPLCRCALVEKSANQGTDTAKLEAKIDGLGYNSYDLTPEAVATVEEVAANE